MLNVFYDVSSYGANTRGPTKVVKNLLQALSDCDISYSDNKEVYDRNIFLGWDDVTLASYNSLQNKDNVLIGPQIWPWDPRWEYLKEIQYTKVIAPSHWVENKLNKFWPEVRTGVWPAPIYTPDIENNIKYDCLVYYKNRSEQDISSIVQFLNQKGVSFVGLQYGNYNPNDFRECLSEVKYCLIVDNTESQGIAIQEMMAVNKPMLVWDVKEWDHMGETYKVPATSVPYWSEDCGEKFYELSELDDTFERFCANIDRYNSKKLVDSELSNKISVKKLLSLFEE